MEPSPIGERSRVLSLPTATEDDLRLAPSRATSSPAHDAPTCRDESDVSVFVRPAGPLEHPPPSLLCGMALAPAMAGSGRRDRLATSAMDDGNKDGRVAETRALELIVPEPSQCCMTAICAQNQHGARMDRPSDRVIARRRGALQSKGTGLADLPVRDAHAPPPAGSNGAASSTGLFVHDDSGPVSALQAQDFRHDRPRATGVARPCEVDVPNRPAAAIPSPRVATSEQPAFANSAVCRSGCVDHDDSAPVCA